MQSISISLSNRPWLRRSLYGFGAFFILLLLYALFGYLALPGIIKSQSEKLARAELNRLLNIERVEFRPFSLALDIHGAKLMEPDGKAIFAGFERLHVDVSMRTLLHLAPVVEGARLRRPYVHVVRTGANRYNFDEIIERLSRDTPPSQKPARFAVFNLQLEQGRIEFDDEPEAAKHVVGDVSLGVPFISSFASDIDVFVEPLLRATLNGAPFMLQGKARPFAEPRDGTVAIKLDRADLTHFVEYLPFKPRFRLPTARLDLDLTGIFRQAKDQTPELLIRGTAAIKSLELIDLDGKPMLKVPLFAVTVDELNVLSSRVSIARVLLDRPTIDIMRAPDGSFNLGKLAPPPSRVQAEKRDSEANFSLSLREVAIQGAQLNYRDDQTRQPLSGGVDKFDLRLANALIDFKERKASIDQVTSHSAAFSLVHGKRSAAASALAAASAPAAAKAVKAKLVFNCINWHY